MRVIPDAYQQLMVKLVNEFQMFAEVSALAVSGSLQSGQFDSSSDIDLYVYTTDLIPLAKREALVQKLGSSKQSLDLTFWDLGDEWFDRESGIEVDVIYWDKAWIEQQVERTLGQQQAWMGYTTCFWHTVAQSKVLFERDGWLSDLIERCQVPYPPLLKQRIVQKNLAVLAAVIPSYLGQIHKALQREDWVSVNHRVAAFLASYFDVLFALNEQPHPGEKRLMVYAMRLALQPTKMREDVHGLLQCPPTQMDTMMGYLQSLVANLTRLVEEQGLA